MACYAIGCDVAPCEHCLLPCKSCLHTIAVAEAWAKAYRDVAAKFHDAHVGAGNAGAVRVDLIEEADNEFCALEGREEL